jgi:hypothetical protein
MRDASARVHPSPDKSHVPNVATRAHGAHRRSNRHIHAPPLAHHRAARETRPYSPPTGPCPPWMTPTLSMHGYAQVLSEHKFGWYRADAHRSMHSPPSGSEAPLSSRIVQPAGRSPQAAAWRKKSKGMTAINLTVSFSVSSGSPAPELQAVV